MSESRICFCFASGSCPLREMSCRPIGKEVVDVVIVVILVVVVVIVVVGGCVDQRRF